MTAIVDIEKELFKEKLKEIFDLNGQRMFIAARGIIGNREDAEDVLQHVFVKIARHIARGKAPKDFMKDAEAFAYRSVTNAARDVVRWRNRQSRKHVDVDSVEIAAPEIDPEPPARVRHLRVALAKIEPNLFQALHLFYFENKNCRQIARIRRRRAITVLSDLYRGRNRVKELIRIQEKQDEAKNKRQGISKPDLAGASATGS